MSTFGFAGTMWVWEIGRKVIRKALEKGRTLFSFLTSNGPLRARKKTVPGADGQR